MRPACGQRCKIITRVFVFLLLGAIVNVAVAWVCSASWSFKRDSFGLTDASRFIPGGYASVGAFRSGVPSRSLQGRLEKEYFQPDKLDGMIVVGNLHLPTRIIWPGFAINTIFYAAILWLLFFAPGSVRRVSRRRRGLCPDCAYPIGTSPVCTECGKSVTGAQPQRGDGM